MYLASWGTDIHEPLETEELLIKTDSILSEYEALLYASVFHHKLMWLAQMPDHENIIEMF